MSDDLLGAQLLVIIVVFALASWGKLHTPKNRMALVYAGAEGVLALLLLTTAALAPRLVTVSMLAAATWVVGELRTSRPDDGCGCFGRLSRIRIGWRTVARTALLALVAFGACWAPTSGLAVLADGPGLAEAVFLLELAVIAAVSPESTALLRRAAVPCDRRRVPLADTMRVLHASSAWRAHGTGLGAPSEVWRELCWRFVVYPAPGGDLVFAVSLADGEVRVAHVPAPSERDDSDLLSAPVPV
ncbi:MauE/DoxX family redox-associated membrane protein [Actinocorallia sp. A-T 12471]|uniref:MauE/DoxX family redox-associated membrane protein n=1 Tax=Actinocorallia sp. A-T 12471 TaxID=3089813 RepID=UPI0029CB52F6|nr:MauE/DoxX family redox-associated membrane protein [Actinocorallia sp. A-T 12471]MDX6742057.1 hypothetical protein [Actinocorallia sp. A-T 12471]